MALDFFTVLGNYQAFSGQEVWDATVVSRPVSGTVLFSPVVAAGDSLKADLDKPARLVLLPVQGLIKDGVVSRNDVVGVRLIANTAALNLVGDLFYHVKFSDVRSASGERIELKEFDFVAPTTSTTVDLVAVTPLPGQPARGDVQLIPGPPGPAGPAGPPGDWTTLAVDGGSP